MLLFITLNAWGYLGVLPGVNRLKIVTLIFVRIKYELEALLGRPVDLVRVREKMDEVLKQTIQEEAIYV